MARPYFTPRREECSLCNAITMVSFAIRREIFSGRNSKFAGSKLFFQMVWNLKVDVRCNSCNRQYYAPTNNPQQRTDPFALSNVEDGSILNQLDEFQMNCTNAWCSFRVSHKIGCAVRIIFFILTGQMTICCAHLFNLIAKEIIFLGSYQIKRSTTRRKNREISRNREISTAQNPMSKDVWWGQTIQRDRWK